MAQHQAADELQRGAKQAAGSAARNPWVRAAARLGYAAIGTVYVLVGTLALRAAAGPGDDAPDQDSALQQILNAPFGRAILGAVAVGLFGYLLWRMIEALLDLRGKGGDAKGLGARAGYVISGLVYGLLGLEAARLAMGIGSAGSGDGQRQEWTARLMELPLGRWLVVLVGLGVIGVGGYHLYKGWSRSFRDELLSGQMQQRERELIELSGVAGYVAHGLVLGLTGLFLVLAALRFNPEEARGLGGALEELASQPFGPWLLGAAALGLAAYGLYRLAMARYYVALAP